MNRCVSAPALAAALAAILLAFPARAQSQADGEAVLARACIDRQNDEISPVTVIEALLIETGISPEDFVGDVSVPASTRPQRLGDLYEAALIARLRAVLAEEESDFPERLWSALNGGNENLKQLLQTESVNVRVVNAGGQDIDLLSESPPTWRMICKTGEERIADIDRLERASPPPQFAVRATPDELWLGGRAGRKAGAFTLGVERSRTTLDDGTRRTDTSFSIAGAVGYRVTPDSSSQGHAFLFANYELQRDRTRPAPQLGPGESESDGDTHALAIGVDGRLRAFVTPTFPIDINLQSAAIFDFANDASRIRLRAIVTPRPDVDIGVCRIGSFSLGFFRRRCEFAGEVQLARVLRRGTTELGDFDTFVAVGGSATFELFIPTNEPDPDTGFLVSARGRYLPVIHGAPDDILRGEFRLAHRFWTAADVGIDVGFTYTRGTNELSFEEEDVLTFGLGIVY